jgi:hypothetical protein
VRYPVGKRWVPVTVSETRAVAAKAYRRLHNDRGQAPMQMRVIGAADLAAKSGDAAVDVAEADIRDRGKRP